MSRAKKDEGSAPENGEREIEVGIEWVSGICCVISGFDAGVLRVETLTRRVHIIA